MPQPLFSADELHKLTVYRRWLFIGFPIIFLLLLCLIGIICHFVFHLEDGAIAGLLGFFTILFTPCAFAYCLSKYKEAVRNMAYHLIAKHLNWNFYKHKEKSDTEFEKNLKNFGLLAENEGILQHNFVQGTKNGYTFSLADISYLATPRHTYAAGGAYGVALGPALQANKETKAQYTVLTVFPNHFMNCEILLKKHKLFKRGIKNFKRINLQDKEIEKLYDVYADQQEQATMLLSPAFTQALAQYIRIHKKQPELIITPQQICVLYNTGIWKKLLSLVIFRSPRVQCEKILKEITNVLDILPVISLLKISQTQI